ncbi:MAG: M56 family metallopeptidase, partial [Alistipes sp.]
MKELMIYALEVLACGGVLLGAYTILLERRVKSRWCRAYLLITTLLSAIIPLLRIPVWAGEVIETVATPTAVESGAWTAEVVAAPTQSLTVEMICAAIYAFGVALILGVIIYQMLRIRGLRRQATISHTARFSLVCTPHKIASFSFFRTIYVWDQTPAEEMTAIVAHEMSHITHHHSTERIAMECMKAALWWNPFVWIAARRLTEAEEFEADSDVIESGYDLENYMNTLFKQLFGYSPDIANGLRNSLTKKRFQMMTKSQKSRYSLLRLAATLPALIGLLCAFSFTTRAAVIRMRDGDADKVLISQVILLNGKPVTTAEVYHLDPLSIDTAYTLRMGDIPAQYKGADMVHYINTKGAPRYSKLITISGRVHYPDGKPASGYNIFAGSICIIPSTQSELDRLGAVSDAQGGYTLKAPAKGSLYSGNFFVATMSSYDNEGANSYHRDIEVIYPDSAKWKSRIEADGRITLLPERRLPAPVEADEPFLVAETMPT